MGGHVAALQICNLSRDDGALALIEVAALKPADPMRQDQPDEAVCGAQNGPSRGARGDVDDGPQHHANHARIER